MVLLSDGRHLCHPGMLRGKESCIIIFVCLFKESKMELCFFLNLCMKDFSFVEEYMLVSFIDHVSWI